MGDFNKRRCFERVAQNICSAMFLQRTREAESSYENLMKSPNN
jgi:hypothetical protein